MGEHHYKLMSLNKQDVNELQYLEEVDYRVQSSFPYRNAAHCISAKMMRTTSGAINQPTYVQRKEQYQQKLNKAATQANFYS